VFSEVCIPLTSPCLHAPLLYSAGLVFLQDQTNYVCGVAATVYRWEQGPWPFDRKLDCEDGGEHPVEACRKARRIPTCAWGRPEAIHGVTQPRAWPLRGLPCVGLQRGLGGKLHASRYLDKNTKVVNWSLHFYLIFSFRIYIIALVVSFTFLSLI
jgi:hypothetical protein